MLSAELIRTGGVVKDSPFTNAIDLIYTTNATPVEIDPGVPKVYTPINTANDFNNLPAPEVVPNVTAIDAPADKKNNTVIVLAAAGLGALLLFSKEGKKAAGIGGIGKKKTSILPLLLVGGAAAAWYFMKEPAAAVAPAATVPPATTTPTYVPPRGWPQDPVQQPGSTNVPVMTAPVEVSTVVRSSVAANNASYLYDAFPQYKVDFDKMSDAEIITAYQYLYGYVGQGLKLYRLPGSTGIYSDGNWNTVLYDAVAALKAKYNLNI